MSQIDGLPYYAQGTVVNGFGRGSKDLGIPTANFPNDVVSQLPETLQCGVYYGWASVDGFCDVHKMVLSVGWNVFYGNKVKTMETHILKQFDQDFYGENLRVVILGYVRPMCNFDSLDALIKEIHNDIQVSEEELNKPKNFVFKNDPFFVSTVSGSGEEKPIRLSSKSYISKGCQEGVSGAFDTQKSVSSSCNGVVLTTSTSSRLMQEEGVQITDNIVQTSTGPAGMSDMAIENGALSHDDKKISVEKSI